ncbi:MAG: hypothetical protein ABJB55_09015 [Actinomycetota bacterium]
MHGHLVRTSPPRRDPTLIAVIAIGIVSVLIAGGVVAGASTSVSSLRAIWVRALFREGVRLPVRWNPCEPIEYQVNLLHAPRGARAAIETAIAQTSKATGLTFVFDGTTSRTALQLRDRFNYADALHAVYRPVVITLVSHRTFRTFDLPPRVLSTARLRIRTSAAGRCGWWSSTNSGISWD